MKKVKKMFSEMTQKHAKAAIDAANIYGGKNEIGHGGRGAIMPVLLCAILNDEKEMRDVVQRLSCPIWT